MSVKIPEFDEVKKGIDELILIEKWDNYKILKNPKTFYERVDSLFLEKIRVMPMIVDLHSSNDFPFKLYRLRKDVKGFNSGLISEYSHPPASVLNYFQRANIPNHPVLYCSDNPATAISEVVKFIDSPNPRERYYLSEWEILPNTTIRLSPFLFENLAKTSFYRFWSDSNFQRLKDTLEKEGIPESYDSFREILRFLSYLFVTENTYVVSSYIAHSHLYAKHSLRSDIFVYPSVQHDKQSVNYAVHPNFVSEKMRLKKVFKLSFHNIKKNEGVEFRLHNFGLNRDSIIYWESDFNKNLTLIQETFPEFEP